MTFARKRVMTIRKSVSVAALLLAAAGAAPAAAQDAPAPPACTREASRADEEGMLRYGCAGTGDNAAVRFSAALPEGWDVEWQDAGHLVLSATQGDIVIQLAGVDQLPAPLTRRDTVGFWMRAARLAAGRELDSLAEMQQFRSENEDDPGKAREWLTLVQLEDSTLLGMAGALSVSQDGREALRQQLEVRELAGAPAGYLSESWMEDGTEWSAISYVTARDGALFIVSLTTPERTFLNVINTFDWVAATFTPRTERQ